MTTVEDLDQALLTPADLALAANAGGSRPWVPYRHLARLNAEIVNALAQPDQFLAVELPIRHGKSLLTTVNGGAWTCLTWPHETLLVACHTDKLMRRFGRQIRSRVDRLAPRYRLKIARTESSAADEWKFEGFDDPTFLGVSVGGTPTGAGAKRIIIDDPVRDLKDLDTIEKRDALWEWYTETLRGRLAPGGSIVLVMSRWHEDDLIGRLFKPEYQTGDPWRRLHLPALAGVDDPLGREPGEALCPELGYTVERLNDMRRTLGERVFAANLQCDPLIESGDMFHSDKWRYTQIIPDGSTFVRWWDNAATEGGTGARTAGVLLARTPDGEMIVVNAVYGRWGSAERNRVQRTTALADLAQWHNVLQGAEQEPGSGGKDQAALFKTVVMEGLPATTETTSGQSKETRAETWAAQQQAGRVAIYTPNGVPEPWVADFIDEHKRFPTGATKDMVDAAAHGYNYLALRSVGPSSLPATGSARRSYRR